MTQEEIKAVEDQLKEEKRKLKEQEKSQELNLKRQVAFDALDERFKIYEHTDGTRRYFAWNCDTNTVRPQQDVCAIERAIQAALQDDFGIQGMSALRARREEWETTTKPIEREPKPFAFVGDPDPAFCRVPFDPTPGDWTAWQEFTDRLSARRVFMAWVWSCYEPGNRSRQYIWLHGNGRDGKSTVFRVLSKPFGEAAGALSGGQLKDNIRFLFSSLYGKHFVVYPDCKNPKFPMTEVIRNLTSGDAVTIEYKGQTPFSAHVRVKMIVGSNLAPEITAQDADVSRLVYIKVAESQNKNDPAWESNLEKQLPAFLYACREEYRALVGDHNGDIPIVGQLAEDIRASAEEFEANYEDSFESVFVADPTARVFSKEVTRIVNAMFWDGKDRKNFMDWMKRERGVSYQKSNGKNFYRGLRLKPVRKEDEGACG